MPAHQFVLHDAVGGSRETPGATILVGHSAAMPQRTNAFQKLLLLLHQQVAQGAIIIESRLLKDRLTGKEAEVDIVVETTASGYPLILSVECIDRSRPATVEWVDQMWGKHEHLPTDKLVLISSAGFSKAASERARARGIDVLSLKEASCVDWTLVVNKLHQVVIGVIEPQCKAFPIIRDADEAILNTVMSRQEELFSQDRKLSTTVGNVLDAVLAPPEVGRVFMDHMCAKDQSVGVFTVEYFFPTPVSLFDVAGNIRDCERLFILDSSGVIRPIDGLRIVIDAQRSRTPIELRHGVLKDSPIAYGSGKGQAGELLVAVVEREQGEATLAVAQQKGVTSKSLVNVDSRSRTPQVTTTSMRVKSSCGKLHQLAWPSCRFTPHLEGPLRRCPTVAEVLAYRLVEGPERRRKPRPSRPPLAGGRVGPGVGPWLAG